MVELSLRVLGARILLDMPRLTSLLNILLRDWLSLGLISLFGHEPTLLILLDPTDLIEHPTVWAFLFFLFDLDEIARKAYLIFTITWEEVLLIFLEIKLTQIANEGLLLIALLVGIFLCGFLLLSHRLLDPFALGFRLDAILLSQRFAGGGGIADSPLRLLTSHLLLFLILLICLFSAEILSFERIFLLLLITILFLRIFLV